jgi:putative transposase
MGAELTEQFGYEKHERGKKETDNRRNGTSQKTVRSDLGPLSIEVPRDRNGEYEPKLRGTLYPALERFPAPSSATPHA